jgi:hypothetical protein
MPAVGVSRVTSSLPKTQNPAVATARLTLHELMERMGHSSTRAAMIYLHVSKGRSRVIADKLNDRLRQARPKSGNDGKGHAEGTESPDNEKSGPAGSPDSRSDEVRGDEGT